MWVHRSAIRPVPPFARIDENAIQAVLASFAGETDTEDFDGAFADFDEAQPVLAHYISGELGRNLSDGAMALGYFLALSVWLSFEHSMGASLNVVSKEALDETCQLMELDHELRKVDESDPLDTDDVIKMEQPRLLNFIHEHIENALDLEDANLEMHQLQIVYKMILVLTLALSYAVRPPAGYPRERAGVFA